MTDLVVSDTHFSHLNMTHAGNPGFTTKRPFRDPQHMNEMLIQYWNAKVKPGDRVFHLGDVCMGQSKYWESTLNRLNGEIFLIKGNHDKKIVNQPWVNRFSFVKDEHEMWVTDPVTGEKVLLVMAHFPRLVWEKAAHGAIHMHGHCHAHPNVMKLNEGTRRIDVGIDNPLLNYAPIEIDRILDVMRGVEYVPIDHHNSDTTY